MNNVHLLEILILIYLSVTVNAKFCQVNSDCAEDSVCTNGLCVCPIGKILNNDGSKCLDISLGIGSECIEDIQCMSWISGPTVCTKDGLCGCQPGYRYFDNACTKINPYNGYCLNDLQCYDGINLNALKCDNNTCVCNEGYYTRDDFDCRLSGKNTKTCFFNMDCESDKECCEFGYGPLGKCISKSTQNNNCSGLEQPKNLFYESFENNNYSNKNSRLNKIDVDCTKDEECSKIVNSFCPIFKKKCTCKDGFVYNTYSKMCVKGLGAKCDADGDCPIPNSYCNKNKLCTCQQYFVNSNYNEKCFKPARGLHMSCARDENCYSLGSYGTCNKNKCDCNFNSEYDEAFMLCRPTSNSGNDNNCKDNCKKKLHSTCIDNVCECEDNYFENNDKCLPDIGYECSEEQNDCNIENAHCINKKCECLEGYLQHGNRSCVQEIMEEEPCTTDIQCENILSVGGVCSNGNCTCSPEYKLMIDHKQNMCVPKRKIGDQCTLSYHCKTMQYAEHVICLNSVCKCDYNYHLIEDENGQRCISGSFVLSISNLLIWAIVGLLIAFN